MKIKRIIEQDPLAPMTDLDKALIWRFKHFIVSSAQSLPKFLQCHSWSDRHQVKEMHIMLAQWQPLRPAAALELLDAKFADEQIRSHAVQCLEGMGDNELALLVLQLVQVCRAATKPPPPSPPPPTTTTSHLLPLPPRCRC